MGSPSGKPALPSGAREAVLSRRGTTGGQRQGGRRLPPQPADGLRCSGGQKGAEGLGPRVGLQQG